MSLNNLDWHEIKTLLSELSVSTDAGEILLNIEPISTVNEIHRSQELIQNALEILNLNLRPGMESLDLYYTWSKRLQQSAVLKKLEINDVRYFCVETMDLREALKQVLEEGDAPWASEDLEQLVLAEEPLSAINQILTPTGEIKIDASETLYNLFKEKNNIAKKIQTVLDKTVKTFAMESVLQDKYVTNREGRWVLPVKSGMQHDFDGIIHARSHSKQTVFMEPKAVIPLNNRLQVVETEMDNEIESLLKDLSTYLK